MNDTQRYERDTLERIRPRYEAAGYIFTPYPPASLVPSFLEGIQPDAIAVKNQEKVVIEVGSSFRNAVENEALKFLAEEVPKHEGWRFDLVVADAPAGERYLTIEEIHQELVSVEELVSRKQYKLALLYCWGLFETAARPTIEKRSKPRFQRHLPKTIVESLISQGVIDDDLGAILYRLASARNALAHGLASPEVGEADVRQLIGVARSLLQDNASCVNDAC